MTTLTDLQLVNVRWNEASTAIATGQNLADLENLPVTFNTKTITGYVIGEKDGAKVVAQIQLLDAVYIPLGAVLDITLVDTLVVAPPAAEAVATEETLPEVAPVIDINVPAVDAPVVEDVPAAEVPTVDGGESA